MVEIEVGVSKVAIDVNSKVPVIILKEKKEIRPFLYGLVYLRLRLLL